MLALSDLIVMNLIVRARQVHPWHYHRFGLRRFVCHLKSIYKQHLGIIRSGEEGGVTYYICIKDQADNNLRIFRAIVAKQKLVVI